MKMKKVLAVMLAIGLLIPAAGALAAGHAGWTELDSVSYKGLEYEDLYLGYTVARGYQLNEGKYCLTEDIDLDPEENVKGYLKIPTGKKVTLCLCCHTISADRYAIEISDDGQLTLEDCEGSGRIVVEGVGHCGVNNGGIFIMNGGTVMGYTGVQNSASEQEKTQLPVFTLNSGVVKGEDTGVINDSAQFIMNGGSIIAQGEDSYGVENNSGTFTMNGGAVEGYVAVYHGTSEEAVFPAEFTMNGGTVKGTACGVMSGTDSDAYERGVISAFNMNGGTVTGGFYGVADVLGKVTVSAGEISGAEIAVIELEGEQLTEEEAEKAYLAKGSRKVEGEFTGKKVVVEKIPAAAGGQPKTGDLPKTGDPSSLLGWAALLGASAMGMKMRRRSK